MVIKKKRQGPKPLPEATDQKQLFIDLTLIRRLRRGRNHGRMPVKPRWIARFAAFAMLRCRDLQGPIDRTIDRIRGWIERLPPKPDAQVQIFTVFEVE